jgi:hypothetical protein
MGGKGQELFRNILREQYEKRAIVDRPVAHVGMQAVMFMASLGGIDHATFRKGSEVCDFLKEQNPDHHSVVVFTSGKIVVLATAHRRAIAVCYDTNPIRLQVVVAQSIPDPVQREVAIAALEYIYKQSCT